jgi:hypothetical protein
MNITKRGLARIIAPALPACVALMLGTPAFAQQPAAAVKPNILVIMSDDIGYWNISAYNRGMMGYHTPNIDRIANEGAIFTDYYGQHHARPAVQPSLLARARCERVF